MMSAEYDNATRDPASHFGDPFEIVDSNEISRADKITLLESWQADLIELQKASEENMPSAGTATGETAENLARVHEALSALKGG